MHPNRCEESLEDIAYLGDRGGVMNRLLVRTGTVHWSCICLMVATGILRRRAHAPQCTT